MIIFEYKHFLHLTSLHTQTCTANLTLSNSPSRRGVITPLLLPRVGPNAWHYYATWTNAYNVFLQDILISLGIYEPFPVLKVFIVRTIGDKIWKPR